MNRIPASHGSTSCQSGATERTFVRLLAGIAALLASANGVATATSAEASGSDALTYQIEFIVTPRPDAGGAWVELKLDQPSNLLRELNMRAPADRISTPEGDGEISLEAERLVWNPPPDGGSLRWFALIDHRRDGGSFDARITTSWAIFRAEDVIPQATTRTLRGALSETTLSFDLPAGWSSLTEYFGRKHSYRIDNPERRFDRPAGWIILGDIGVRYDRIAGLRVNVAGPVEQGLRRTDILALLHWTLPEVVRIVPDFPKRLTVIGAGDPMWRGGLSGPRSLFIHADRPLISENATSTLLHEVMHIALGNGATTGMDWVVEGLAEYYSLAILHRSGTISDRRFAEAMRKQSEWGSSVSDLCAAKSSGAITARAVTVMADLDNEIRAESGGRRSLDDVLLAVAESEKMITLGEFLSIAGQFNGGDPKALRSANLPGCEI